MIWPFAICILACIICGTVALTKRWVLNHEWQKAVMRNSNPPGQPEHRRNPARRQFMGEYEYDEPRQLSGVRYDYIYDHNGEVVRAVPTSRNANGYETTRARVDREKQFDLTRDRLEREMRQSLIEQRAIDVALSDMQVGLEKRITNLEKNLATHAHDYGRVGPPVSDFGEGQLDRVFREMGGISHRW